MQCRAKRGISCVPVTALHVVEAGSEVVLLYSQGSVINVASARSGAVAHSRRVFNSEIIHGIANCFSGRHGATAKYNIVIWGGRSICTAVLTINHTVREGERSGLYFETARPMVLDDWIMTVMIDNAKQQTLILTAHNVLWALSLSLEPVNPLACLASGMSTLLYSGAIAIVDDGRVLVASGTVFGEVIVWKISAPPSEESASLTRHLFLGHKGSVFGVAISDKIIRNNRNHRLLASCSDDRSIRIWDISDCDEAETPPSVIRVVSVSTGFGFEHDQGLEMAVAWGHSSRIWGVHFLGVVGSDSDVFRVVSRGEDGTCQFWSLPFDQTLQDTAVIKKNSLQMVGGDRHHAGKNIWCLTIASGYPQPSIYTGGADGQVISRQYPGAEDRVENSIEFPDLAKLLQSDRKRSLRQYLVLESGTIIATTDQGEVIQTKVKAIENWHFLYQPISKTTTVLCENSADGLVFYCLAAGTMYAHDVANDRSLGIVGNLSAQAAWMQIVNFEYGLDNTRVVRVAARLYGSRYPELLKIFLKRDGVSTSSQIIYLPHDFAITASLYCSSLDLLICGSRAGALTVLTASGIGAEAVEENSIIRHVHGSDMVTSITILSRTTELVHLLTTGRDGTFAVHSLQVPTVGLNLCTVHRVTLPLGPYIEGAFLRKTGTQQQSLYLYGFKSKDFVVWNESDQTQVLSIDCGGAHRSWSFSPCHGGTDVFVWTKAGTFNCLSTIAPTRKTIRNGGHGREIKTLAVSPLEVLPMPDGVGGREARLIATGAEDTDIRLMICSHTSLYETGVLRHHTTGLQALCFSSCGHYLFSSGGVEEFVVWRLTRIPVIGVGAVVVCTLPKVAEDEDARIMSFDVIDQDSNDSRARLFYIAMAYSNGKAKVFEFCHESNNSCGRLRLLRTLVMGTLCLSQIRLLKSETSLSMLIGATDGLLRYSSVDVFTDGIVLQHLHQSNIATMSVCEIYWQIHIVVTGGDDNGLAITLLQVLGSKATFETLLIPRAHAAALTATTIVRPSKGTHVQPIYIVSGGNDQRVQVWQVLGLNFTDIDAREINEPLELAKASLERVCEYTVDVADISDLQLLHYREVQKGVEFEILVVGVGMQSVSFEVSS